MQNKQMSGYDDTKKMLNTLRKLNENRAFSNNILREEIETQQPQNQEPQEKDFTVINDVEVKLLSSDPADMNLLDDQKTAISTLIDNFRQQVDQIAEFKPGMSINSDQVRLDGTLTNEDISFVFIAGKESGVYINADMLKLEQNTATALEKLVKFQSTFETSMEPLLTQRDNN
jgi:hypothetical protein